MSTLSASQIQPQKAKARLYRIIAAVVVATLTVFGIVSSPPSAHAAGPVLNGTITSEDTDQPLQYALVYLDSVATGFRESGNASTDANGDFHFDSVSADGEYTLFISAYNVAGGYATEYYPRKQFKNSALPIALSNSAGTTLDFTLERGGFITGNVSFDGEYHTAATQFLAYDPVDSHWGFVQYAGIDGAGDYLGRALAPGQYKMKFFDTSGADEYQDEYYNNRYTLADADIVTVTAGEITSGIDIELSRGVSINVTRLAGANRYETSARIAQEYAGADSVIVANGLGYPDALSAAPAAALLGSPLLLTAKDYLPAVVKTEIERLNPSDIYVIGGTGVVSDAVFDELELLGGDVHRLFGANRYATSMAVLNEFWPHPSYLEVFLADGRNFPDALSAASAAGKLGGPVTLVNGGLGALPSDLKSNLADKDVFNAWIAGGSAVLSNGIQASAESIPDINLVERYWGADRYATSRAINQRFFSPTIDTVYFAVGSGFADALSGAALAGKFDAPLYLVPSNCVPGEVLNAMVGLGVTKVVLLGGTGVLSSRVESLTEC